MRKHAFCVLRADDNGTTPRIFIFYAVLPAAHSLRIAWQYHQASAWHGRINQINGGDDGITDEYDRYRTLQPAFCDV